MVKDRGGKDVCWGGGLSTLGGSNKGGTELPFVQIMLTPMKSVEEGGGEKNNIQGGKGMVRGVVNYGLRREVRWGLSGGDSLVLKLLVGGELTLFRDSLSCPRGDFWDRVKNRKKKFSVGGGKMRPVIRIGSWGFWGSHMKTRGGGRQKGLGQKKKQNGPGPRMGRGRGKGVPGEMGIGDEFH